MFYLEKRNIIFYLIFGFITAYFLLLLLFSANIRSSSLKDALVLNDFKSATGHDFQLDKRKVIEGAPVTLTLHREVTRQQLKALGNSELFLVLYRLNFNWCRVYFNGRKITTIGSPGRTNAHYWNDVFYLPLEGIPLQEVNLLKIEVGANFLLGGAKDSIFFTGSRDIHTDAQWFEFYLQDMQLIIMGYFFFAFIILFPLYFLLPERDRYEYLMYALSSICFALSMLEYSNEALFNLSLFSFRVIQAVSLHLSAIFISIAINIRFHSRVILTAIGINSAVLAVLLLFFTGTLPQFHRAQYFADLFLLFTIFSWAYGSCKYVKYSSFSKIVFTASLILFLSGSVDIGFIASGMELPHTISVYGSTVFLSAVLFVIVFDFFRIMQKVQSETEKAENYYQASIIDSLTQVYNRKYVEELMQTNKRNYCLMLVDLDDFKMINDSRGHVTGDLVLKHVADSARKVVRDTDIVARYGGDEFIIILFQSSIETAKRIGRRLMETLDERDSRILPEDVEIKLSVGLYHVNDPGESLDRVIEKADMALYNVKQKGKNDIVCYNDME